MKRKITYKILLVIVVTINCLAGTAQNYREDMQKIREYNKTRYHSFRMKFEFCPYDSLSSVADSMTGKCLTVGNYYYYRFKGEGNEYEYVKNAGHYVVIDHGNHIIALTESSKARAELWNMAKIDSLISISAMKVNYKDISKNEGEYNITFIKGTWNRLKLVFNKERYTLDKVVLYSPEKGTMSGINFNKPRINISYADYSETMPDNNVFSDAKYLISQGNKMVPTETYKGYKVLDYLKKN